jgi:hypothetical protein
MSVMGASLKDGLPTMARRLNLGCDFLLWTSRFAACVTCQGTVIAKVRDQIYMTSGQIGNGAASGPAAVESARDRASTDGRLSLFFLPPYSPELNRPGSDGGSTCEWRM